MIRICFVCLGNICRSPMAEFMLKDKLKKLNLENDFFVSSRATSYEEQGSPMHYGTKEILDKNNILYTHHVAKRLEKEDYDKYDYFICMDESNMQNTQKIFVADPCHKIVKLLSSVNNQDVKDPWYTGNFEETYEDIKIGIDALLEKLKKNR